MSEPGARTDPSTDPLLAMVGVVKVFPGVRALDGVDLDVRAGEVHALLGQNGAGKSTLIKVLAGAHRPDAGTITWRGEQVTLASPAAATRQGIATIHQELELVDGLSVAENVYLGHERARGGFLDRSDATSLTHDLLVRLGHAGMRPGTEVGTLSAANKQIVSMARALSHDARLIVMDEPSAVLDAGEVENLFRVVRQLTGQGVAIVYITHRLEEIREIGDRVTVLKDGRTVATGLPVADTPTPELIRLMTGRSLTSVFPLRSGVTPTAAPLLEVQGLSRTGEFSDVSFSVRPGEILGLAGLVGSGRSEILETVYGARRPTAGSVTIAGTPVRTGSVGSAVAAGVGLAPEERKSQGLLLDQSITRNISLATLGRFATGGFLRRAAERDAAQTNADALQMRPADIARNARTLSGGNQQKVVLARWLLHGCKVLLLDEPTRGVDVGARSEIYTLVRRLAAEGVAVVVVSSEIEEVLGLSDRVLVIAEGRVVHESPAASITEHEVLEKVMQNATEGAAA